MVVLGIVPPIAVLAVVYGRFMRSITRKVQDALAVSTEVSDVGRGRGVDKLTSCVAPPLAYCYCHWGCAMGINFI